MTAFKNDRPQFQSFTESYQAFEQPPAKSIKWWLLVQKTLFKQIQDCADYSEAGGVLTDHPQQINVGYAKIFATGHFMSACRRWNETPPR
jgi:hypothetical protein